MMNMHLREEEIFGYPLVADLRDHQLGQVGVSNMKARTSALTFLFT